MIHYTWRKTLKKCFPSHFRAGLRNGYIIFAHDFAIQHLQLKIQCVDVFPVCPIFKQHKTHNFMCVELGDYVLSFFILIYIHDRISPFSKFELLDCFFCSVCNLSQIKHPKLLKWLYTLDIQFWIFVSNFFNLPNDSLILAKWLTCQICHHLTFCFISCDCKKNLWVLLDHSTTANK